jgi:crotonobetainyl-CoA:carnitine CoA-transferase CaiB-like acyl-CoA transferase
VSAPLEGVRVLEVANMIAGPSAGALLADLGAEVTKVEPPGGVIHRGAHPPAAGPEGQRVPDAWWHLDNRGKRGIVVDLTTTEGVAVVHRLAAGADVFLTNLTDERRVRYRLTADDVLAANPAAVYALVGGYGTEGPLGGRPAYDMTAFFARGGVQGLLGEPTGPPPAFRPGQGDHTTALALLAAVLAALRQRDRTGEGQVVEVALYQVAAWTISSDLSVSLLDRTQPTRPTREHWPNALTCRFRCADGRWVALCMPGPRDYWPAFAECVGRPEWADDERYRTPAGRLAHAAELMAEVDACFATADRDTWTERLDAAGLTWAPVHELPEVIEDPQARALGLFTRVDDPVAGCFETVAAPFHLRSADVGVRGPGPALGEHTRAVLREVGYTPSEIDELVTRGAVAARC